MAATLEAGDIRKAYDGVAALAGVGLAIRPGRIHALVGQNGAGKSTLVRLLGGVEQPDAGWIAVDGKPQRFRSPLAAQHAGIQTIYQELSAIPQLTVAENIVMGSIPARKMGIVNWRSVRSVAADALQRVGFDIRLDANMEDLSVAEQQAVELAKALQRDARVLLLDEPTSTLPPPDTERLFEVLRRLSADGVGMLFISHRLEEIFDLCSDITVFRDGRQVGTFATENVSRKDIVTAMIGRSLLSSREGQGVAGAAPASLGAPVLGTPVLRVDKIVGRNRFDAATFQLRKGEAFGIVGLVGAGQSELASYIAGAKRPVKGTIALSDGRKVVSMRSAIQRGIGLLPQDRKSSGYVPEMSVAANMTLAAMKRFTTWGLYSHGTEKIVANDFAKSLGMRITGVQQEMRTLSGGTQQKVIIARWLIRQAKILVCDEPTRGVDVGAKEDIYNLLGQFSAAGGSVVIATSEVSEALMCDRVLAISSSGSWTIFEREDFGHGGDHIVEAIS